MGGTACWNSFFVGLNHSLSMKNSIFVHSYLCCLKQNVKIQCKAQAKTLRKAFLQHINCFYLVLCLCRLISDFVRKLKNVWPLIPLHCCLKDLLYSLNWSCHMQAMSPELHTFYTSTEGAGTCCSILLNDRCRHSEKCSTSVLCRRRRNQTCKINCFFPLCICGDLGASVLI